MAAYGPRTWGAATNATPPSSSRSATSGIHLVDGVSRRDHRRAIRWGPRAVASRREQARLLEQAGFVKVEQVDVTPEYLETARGWLLESWRLEPGLRQALGDAEFDRMQTERPKTIAVIEDGLHRRSLLIGTAPGR